MLPVKALKALMLVLAAEYILTRSPLQLMLVARSSLSMPLSLSRTLRGAGAACCPQEHRPSGSRLSMPRPGAGFVRYEQGDCPATRNRGGRESWIPFGLKRETRNPPGRFPIWPQTGSDQVRPGQVC
jgi:hypothetical protein